MRLDEAPDAALLVFLGQLARLPGGDAPGALDFLGDDVTAEVGREEAEPGERARLTVRAGERDIRPERDANEPHLFAAGAVSGANELLEVGENATVADGFETQLDQHQV